MSVFYLRFPDEETARKVGAEWLQLDEKGNYLVDVATETWCYHVIGALWRGAVYAKDGETVVEPAVQKPGFHINVQTEALPEALLPYEVHPATPEHVFAGVG